MKFNFDKFRRSREDGNAGKKAKRPGLKSIIALSLSFVLMLSCSFAYFTDYLATSTTGTAGTVEVSLDDSGINLLNPDGQDILNPGDARPVAFTVTNDGNKSVDTEVIITLTSSVPMCNNQRLNFEPMSLRVAEEGTPDPMLYEKEVYSSEYELYLKDDVVFVDGYGHYPKADAEPLQVRYMNAVGTQIAYILDSEVLSGNMSLDEQEKEYKKISNLDDVNYASVITAYEYALLSDTERAYYAACNDTKTYEIVLVFDPNSGNEFQNSSVSIQIEVKAKQHHNTEMGWELVGESTNASIDTSVFTVENNPFGQVELTGVQDGVDLYSLTDIEIPEGVEVIPNQFFQGWENLKTVKLPSTLKVIGDLAFKGCRGMTSINLPEGLEFMGNWAFGDCNSLTEIAIPDSVTYVGESTFRYSGVENVTIGSGLTYISNHMFAGTELKSIVIPSTVKEIGEYAFYQCQSLTNIEISEGVTSIGLCAFSGCQSLTNFTIPSSVTEIGDSAFNGCWGLTTVVMPEGVTRIGKKAFSSCDKLTTVVIPDSVTRIGDRAFYHYLKQNLTVYTDSVLALNSDYGSRVVTFLPYEDYNN